MGWPACVVTCVGIVSFCAMICFVAKYGFDAVKGIDLDYLKAKRDEGEDAEDEKPNAEE